MKKRDRFSASIHSIGSQDLDLLECSCVSIRNVHWMNEPADCWIAWWKAVWSMERADI